LEIAYFTLETNPKATWAYTDSIGFGNVEYTWNKGFSSNKLKKVNELATKNEVRDSNRRICISKDDEWKDENEWEEFTTKKLSEVI